MSNAFSYSSSGLDAFVQRCNEATKNMEAQLLAKRNALITSITNRILALTPVWEGTTLANWRWSVGEPATGEIEAAGGDTPPGKTSEMSLGEEPRREANEELVRASLAAVLADKSLDDLYLINNHPNAIAVEFGLAPTEEKSRVNGETGVLRLAIKEALATSAR